MQVVDHETVCIADGAVISVQANSPSAAGIAKRFANLITRTRGLHLRATQATNPRGTIHYTTDGSIPSMHSAAYNAPIRLPAGHATMLRAATLTRNGFTLAAARTRRIDAASLHTHHSDQLDTCSRKIVLRIEDDRPLDGPRPIYKMDINNICWIWKQVPLTGMRNLAVTVGNLPWNYQL